MLALGTPAKSVNMYVPRNQLHCTLMKASARKTFPNKQAHAKITTDKLPDYTKTGNDPDSWSDGTEAANPVLEAEGEALIGERAMNTVEHSPSTSHAVKPKRHGKRPRKGVPKNYPFDASLVLNADPPYALGEADIDSIHLYQMGKKDETGAYIVLEQIRLFD